MEVISAFELTAAQSDALKTALHRKFDKDISIEAR